MKSNNRIKRMIKGGAVKIDGERVTDPETKIQFFPVRIQVGKDMLRRVFVTFTAKELLEGMFKAEETE